jgi:hypothetical protein
MGEEPNLPPIPDLGEILYRKERYIEAIYTIIKCDKCQAKNSRTFEPGDYTFKKLENEECKECHRKGSTIVEIYSEWIDPKKRKKKKSKKSGKEP